MSEIRNTNAIHKLNITEHQFTAYSYLTIPLTPEQNVNTTQF